MLPTRGEPWSPGCIAALPAHLYMSISPVVTTPANSPSGCIPRGVCRISESKLLVPRLCFLDHYWTTRDYTSCSSTGSRQHHLWIGLQEENEGMLGAGRSSCPQVTRENRTGKHAELFFQRRMYNLLFHTEGWKLAVIDSLVICVICRARPSQTPTVRTTGG